MSRRLTNAFMYWILKKRYHQIERFKKYPLEVQDELLRDLLRTASHTAYGERYDFSSITDFQIFQDRLPIHTYESIEADIERIRKGAQNIFWPTPIKWFAKSSGTTQAKSKFIPVSTESLKDCHYRAGKDMLSIFYNNHPESKLLMGKTLSLSGSCEIYGRHRSHHGDLSAVLIENLPPWAARSTTPSPKVALMRDWESKLDAIAEETIEQEVTGLAGVPSWMLALLNRILEKTQKDNIAQVWPNLELFLHGGVNFAPYAEPYKKIIGAPIDYCEIYNASEGFFAIQDQSDCKDLLLMLDCGIFYEFIPMEAYGEEKPKTVNLKDVELQKNYAVVISTNAGLWRYQIGDTIRFTDLKPYRIRITGRTKHYINAFGEELIIENAEEALRCAAEQTRAQIKEYTAAPIFMKGKESGAHEWIIEFHRPPADIATFAEHLDNALKGLNSDYEAKRYRNITLNPPVIHRAKRGLFYDWMKKRRKLGGQNKVPRLSNSREYLEPLLQLNA